MAAEGKRRGLGRGLSALIMDTAITPVAPEVAAQAEAGGVKLVDIDHLLPNPRQPRTTFDPAALEELAASIRTHGVIQPLVVTAAADQPERYWLIAGERRWRAARIAGLKEVPVIVREATPQQLMEWALVENVQRADLNPIEEATAFQTLMTEFGLTQAEVAERVGKSRPAITNTVRLLSLPMEVQQAVIDGQITAGHARALLGLSDPEAILRALSEVIRRELSVRQTEAFVRRMNETLAKPASSATEEDTNLQSHLRYLEDRFRSALGTKVTLHRNPDGGGKLIVHFYSDEDLESLFHLITGGEDG